MFLFFLFSAIPASCQNSSGYPTFNQAIFNNPNLSKYDKKESPYDVFRERMLIKVEVGFVVLTKVIEAQQLVSYIANVVFTWQDKRLEFDPDVLGYNITVIPSNSIWIPTLDCFNCVGVKKFDKETDSNEAIVTSDGNITVSLKASFDTICNVQLENFPFDTQFCGIDFNGGFAGGLQQARVYVNDNISMQIILSTPEWNIYHEDSLQASVNPDSFVGVRFKLVRNPTFYIVLLILPTLIVCTVCLSALTLPLDFTKSARFTMAASGLVGLTFLLGTIIQQVPRSQSVPTLGRWVLMEEFMVFFALMINEPIKFLKQKCFEKHPLTQDTIDFVKFGLIVGSNILATILMFTLQPTPKRVFSL